MNIIKPGKNSRLIRKFISLRNSQGRARHQLTLCEGSRCSFEAARILPVSAIEAVLITADGVRHLSGFSENILDQVPVIQLPVEILGRITEIKIADGICLVIRVNSEILPLRTDLNKHISGSGIYILLEEISDPVNLGAIFRIARCASVDEVFVCGGVDPFNPRVVRGSMAACFSVNITKVSDPRDLLTSLHNNGILSVATAADAVNAYWEIDQSGPVCYVMGNEGRGLTNELRQFCSTEISIPIHSGFDSLNVAVSSGIIVYEAVRQRSCVKKG